ncbi:MAG TPA: alpha/beta hydrolase [Acidimicrobiales bacterium]|nr:alpha/beta hydrolase [Acidimicrobiales bacterium]
MSFRTSPPARARATPIRPVEGAETSGSGTAGPRLETSDGVELATRIWPAAEGARAIVVLAHGLTANKDEPHVVSLASELHGQGFDVIAYDSRGHGQSGGQCTLGDLERHDVAAVVEWARTRNRRVVLVGASMGAVGVLSYATTATDVIGVVTVSSPGEWRLPLRIRSMITASLARTRTGREFARRRMNVRIAPWTAPESPRSLVKRISVPLAVVHGRRDAIIPPGAGLARVIRDGPGRSVALVQSMGHAFDPIGHRQICDAVTWALLQDQSLAAVEPSLADGDSPIQLEPQGP